MEYEGNIFQGLIWGALLSIPLWGGFFEFLNIFM